LMQSFQILLSRKKFISDHHKITFTNMIRFIRKLMNLALGDKEKIRQLKLDMDSTQKIADNGWLHEKVEELMGTKKAV